MFEITNYGDVASKYSGVGEVVLRGVKVQCDFEVHQLHSNRVFVNCLFKKFIHFQYSRRDPRVDLQLRGITKEQYDLLCQGKGIVLYSGIAYGYEYEETLVCSMAGFDEDVLLKVVRNINSTISSYRFHLVNLVLFHDPVLFQIQGVKCKIERVPDSSDFAILNREKGISITSYLTIETLFSSEEEMNKFVGAICNLLSLAKGTLINWICYDELDDQGLIVCSYHDTWRTMSFQSIELIAFESTHFSEYLERGFEAYSKISKDYDMERAMQLFLYTHGYEVMESHALVICSLIDYLSNIYVSAHSSPHLTDEKTFKKFKRKILKPFIKLVQDIATELEFDDKNANSYFEQINNRKSFRDKLEFFVNQLKAPITTEEISIFVKSRNSIVHTSRFSRDKINGSNSEEFYEMLHFLDRTMLALLKYTGPYTNVVTMRNSPIGSNNDHFELK